MTRTSFIPVVRKQLIWSTAATCLALATALMAGSASAAQGDYVWGLFHTSENASMCINDPYQSTHDGTQMVVNQHCNFDDPASNWMLLEHVWSRQELVFGTSKCMDNLYGDQSNGNPIVIWVCNDGATQDWNWDGHTFHYVANPNKCINIAWGGDGEGKLVLWDCNGQQNQKFNFEQDRSAKRFAPHATCIHWAYFRGLRVSCLDM
jgi:hypothetical protein